MSNKRLTNYIRYNTGSLYYGFICNAIVNYTAYMPYAIIVKKYI